MNEQDLTVIEARAAAVEEDERWHIAGGTYANVRAIRHLIGDDVPALVAEVRRYQERERRIRAVLSERITVTRHDGDILAIQVADYSDPDRTSSVQRAFTKYDTVDVVLAWIPEMLRQVASHCQEKGATDA